MLGNKLIKEKNGHLILAQSKSPQHPSQPGPSPVCIQSQQIYRGCRLHHPHLSYHTSGKTQQKTPKSDCWCTLNAPQWNWGVHWAMWAWVPHCATGYWTDTRQPHLHYSKRKSTFLHSLVQLQQEPRSGFWILERRWRHAPLSTSMELRWNK